MRGFSEGKSEVVNLQRPLFKPNTSSFLYTACLLHKLTKKNIEGQRDLNVGALVLGMKVKKRCQETLFAHYRLSERIPKSNFYRRLKEVLELRFLYGLTQGYYGDSGQKSIEPVVFFTLCLVGYVENIISDRKLMAHCSLR